MELKNFTRKENGSVVAELYLKETESTLTLTYTLNNNGELTVEQDLKVNPDAENKPNLLRYGMELQMPKSLIELNSTERVLTRIMQTVTIPTDWAFLPSW